MKTFFLIVLLLNLSTLLANQDGTILDSWTGEVVQGGMPCQIDLTKVSADQVNVTVSPTVYTCQGNVKTHHLNYESAKLTTRKIDSGELYSVYKLVKKYAGFNKTVLTIVFKGDESAPLNNIFSATVAVPCGTHFHNYNCRFK